MKYNQQRMDDRIRVYSPCYYEDDFGGYELQWSDKQEIWASVRIISSHDIQKYNFIKNSSGFITRHKRVFEISTQQGSNIQYNAKIEYKNTIVKVVSENVSNNNSYVTFIGYED